MRLPASHVLALTALVFLTGCKTRGGSDGELASAGAPFGPAADYPIVLGEPYTVGTTVWRPEDRLNYDEVGRAALGTAGGAGVTVAHKTLPLPSYVEVVALDSGRTILARVERRGPMNNSRLVELSPGAARELGILNDGAPVRVRRLNPPEAERAFLRAGQTAPARMDTPKPLLDVLLRRLSGPGTLAAETPPPARTTRPAAMKPARSPAAKPSAATAATAPPASTVPRVSEGFVVQVAALSARDRAEEIARALGGQVEPAGRLFRVRIGPFASTAKAAPALAKARAAGYSEARIQRLP